jgi:phosphate starvation-inducible protein PhoH
LKTTQQHLEFTAPREDNARLANLCGPLDENLRQIEQALDVTLQRRGHRISIRGRGAKLALTALENFYNSSRWSKRVIRHAAAPTARRARTRAFATTRIIRSTNRPIAATKTSKHSVPSCTRAAPICAAARRRSVSI